MGTDLARPMWRVSPSFPAYDVNTLGEVRRGMGGRGARRNRKVAPQEHQGYAYVHLWWKQERTAVRRNRLVAEAFYGPIPEGMEVNHKNGERFDDAPLNLELVTPAENVQHSYRELGREPAVCGDAHHAAKVDETTVRWMRDVWPQWKAKGRTQAELGEVVGLSDGTVSRILNQRAWKHVASETRAPEVWRQLHLGEWA